MTGQPPAARWPPRRAMAVAAGVALVVAGLGGLATDIGPWYAALRRPPWQPPDWAFGPAWTLIYSVSALAAARGWQLCQAAGPAGPAGSAEPAGSADPSATRRTWVALWVVNAGLNLLWSLLFFRLQRPDWALVENGALWLSVALLWWAAPHGDRWVRWLIAPYLAWVTFAGVLNVAVVRLNAPFGAH